MNHAYEILSVRPKAWVSVETIQLVGMESQRGGFWPRLCRLKCNIGWETVPFISSFLTPTITNLDLTLPRESNRLLQPTLSLLTHTCHQLQSLKMDVDAFGPLSGGEMGCLISASRHTLRRVDIRSPTPPEIFPVISSLPRLRDLSLQDPRFPNQIAPEILPRLEAIIFNGNHGSNLTQFLKRLPAQRLANVSISRGETIQLSTLLESLRGATATMNMLYLSPVTTLDHSSVILICYFTNLTSLTIRCSCEELGGLCSFDLTDEKILELGETLAHMRSLSLGAGCRGPRHVTFTSLTCLSRMCGNLESLSIRVDFASIVGGSDQLNHTDASLGVNSTRPSGERSRLCILTVGNSPLPDIPRCEWVVALALVSIFPSVKFLFSYCSGEMHKRWDKVRGDILVCQKIFHITRARGKHLDT